MQDEIRDNAQERMDKAVESLSESLSTLRAGRANPQVLKKVTIDYYGVKTPLLQTASISTPDPHTITIQPYDPSLIQQIERAIIQADLGFNPSNDGKLIRLIVPQLTEDRRKELVKQAKKYSEEGKVAVRNIRRKALADLKAAEKDSEITEDDLKDAEKEIQKLTDDQIKEIDKIFEKKKTEIMEV